VESNLLFYIGNFKLTIPFIFLPDLT
jgi:hypothetical protein